MPLKPYVPNTKRFHKYVYIILISIVGQEDIAISDEGIRDEWSEIKNDVLAIFDL